MDEAPGRPAGLLNRERPPVYCPGCGHDQVVKALDRAFVALGLGAASVTLVSDIGCSGLFDTFFRTHAFHGLHGRVLTYAAGIKLARPRQTVVATMGDGGLGIGGAHLLAACRRNLDLTLLILNNFNFGMTGGQYSPTTPPEARVASAFLNRLERPLDVAGVLVAAGAPFVVRCSAYDEGLPGKLAAAMGYPGFSAVEILGICPGRYTGRNAITPGTIASRLAEAAPHDGEVEENRRPEYGAAYRQVARGTPLTEPPRRVKARFVPAIARRTGVLILGAAGQRVNTAGELLGLAGMAAGLRVTQKAEYDITVLRGPSIAELILSPDPIEFTGLESPDVVLALAEEGVARRRDVLAGLAPTAHVFRSAGVGLPPTLATVHDVDLAGMGIRKGDRALAMVAVLARAGRTIDAEMLDTALGTRFSGDALAAAKSVLSRVRATAPEP